MRRIQEHRASFSAFLFQSLTAQVARDILAERHGHRTWDACLMRERASPLPLLLSISAGLKDWDSCVSFTTPTHSSSLCCRRRRPPLTCTPCAADATAAPFPPPTIADEAELLLLSPRTDWRTGLMQWRRRRREAPVHESRGGKEEEEDADEQEKRKQSGMRGNEVRERDCCERERERGKRDTGAGGKANELETETESRSKREEETEAAVQGED